MPLLRNFLGCCNLRTGAMIIGWIGGVASFVVFLVTSVVLSELPSEQKHFGLDYDPINYANQAVEIQTKIALKIGMGMSVISLVTHGLLLYGTYKEKKLLLIPFLISLGVKIVGYVITVLVFTGLLMATDQVGFGFLLLFIGFLWNGIIAYIWICILSLYQVLREGEQLGPIRDDCVQIINSSVPYRNFEV